MPARDILHDAVLNALLKDGWTITDDPFTITYGIRYAYADLGAEKTLAAVKDNQKIVVEIESFVGLSKVRELECAMGQYLIYRSWLKRTRPEYQLFLALDSDAFQVLFIDVSGQVLIEDYELKFVIINAEREEITRWIVN